MTSKERVLKALAFEKTDTIPIYDIINNLEVYARYSDAGDITKSSNVEEVSAKLYKTLDIDATRGFYNPKWQIGAVEGWKKYVNAPEKGWQVDYDDSTSWISSRPHASLDDIKKAMPKKPDYNVVEKDFIDAFMYRRNFFDPEGVMIMPSVGGFLDITYRYVEYELFCLGMYTEPDLIEELLEVFWALQKSYIDTIVINNLSAVIVYCDDIAFKSSLLFSPKWLETHYFPRLKKLFEPAKAAGVKIIFHSDGHLHEIMDNLVACNIDGLNPLEKLAGMDIVEVRKKYPRLALVGGIDCSELLSYGSKEQIYKEIERIINSIGNQGGLMLGSSSEVHNGIPAKNAKFMYDTIRELGAKL